LKIIPRPGKVYVRLDRVDEMRKGSIILPGMHSEPARIGTILGVGASTPNMSTDGLTEGMRFACGYNAGEVLNSPRFDFGEDGPEMHRIISPLEIWCMIEE